MKRTQLNAVVSESAALRARKSALELNVSLGGIVEAAIDHFLRLPIAQRRMIFDDNRFRKLKGRPLAKEQTA